MRAGCNDGAKVLFLQENNQHVPIFWDGAQRQRIGRRLALPLSRGGQCADDICISDMAARVFRPW